MSPRRRRKRPDPATCRDCGARVEWFRFQGRWKTFAPKPVDPLHHSGPPAYPTESKTAWLVGALIDELMGRRGATHAEAREEVYDLTWYAIHTCPTATGATTDRGES